MAERRKYFVDGACGYIDAESMFVLCDCREIVVRNNRGRILAEFWL